MYIMYVSTQGGYGDLLLGCFQMSENEVVELSLPISAVDGRRLTVLTRSAPPLPPPPPPTKTFVKPQASLDEITNKVSTVVTSRVHIFHFSQTPKTDLRPWYRLLWSLGLGSFYFIPMSWLILTCPGIRRTTSKQELGWELSSGVSAIWGAVWRVVRNPPHAASTAPSALLPPWLRPREAQATGT